MRIEQVPVSAVYYYFGPFESFLYSSTRKPSWKTADILKRRVNVLLGLPSKARGFNMMLVSL